MPRSLQPDRQLFGTTLALCLIGAVMVFSASAVTAREEYGNGYTFLIRQLLWVAIGLAGMFKLMNTDYRNLRQPRVIFTALSVTLMLLIAVFFLDRSHATHRWARLRTAQFSAVGTREARGDFFPSMVSSQSHRASQRGGERPVSHPGARFGNPLADCGIGGCRT